MDALAQHPLSAIVYSRRAGGRVSSSLPRESVYRAVLADLRVLKAVLLYADRVNLYSLSALTLDHMTPLGAFRWDDFVPRLIDGREASSSFEILEDLMLADKSAGAFSRELLATLQPVNAAGALVMPPLYPVGIDYAEGTAFYDDDNLVQDANIVAGTADRGILNPRAQWEGAIAFSLLGQLEAFPDASIDVILDVRERLAGPRKHFRAAVAETARRLADAGTSTDELPEVVAQLRAKEIDSALQNIRESLDSLKVRRTLQRVGSDPRAIAAGAAVLSMTAHAGGGLAALRAIASAALGAPTAVAASLKEMEYRSDKLDELRARPYWLLHEANERMRRR